MATATPPIANIAFPVTTDPPAELVLCEAVLDVIVGVTLPVAVGPDLMTPELLVVAVPAVPVAVGPDLLSSELLVLAVPTAPVIITGMYV
jgi:hypothetical protein